MSLTRLLRSFALAAAALGALTSATARAQAQGGEAAPTVDPLANIVVTGTAGERPLPKIAVVPSISPHLEDVTLRTVVRRDLELSGEFDVLSDDKAPDGLWTVDRAVSTKEYAAKGAEMIVRVTGRKLDDKRAELGAQAWLVSGGDTPILDKRWEVPLDRVRIESHQIADQLIGAFTGSNGGFYSHLTFASGTGTLRRVYRIDADGFDAKPVSPTDHIAIAPAYDHEGKLFWAASVKRDEYKVFRFTGADKAPELVPTNVRGSIYGLAWNRDGSRVAASVAQGSTIQVFAGPSLDKLERASDVGFALRPAFSPTGKLAFSGAGKFGQRIHVDGKAVSPDGFFASAPTFCRHPDGIRLVFAVGVGKNTDLVATGESGGQLYRLTQNQGSNGYPACSPDGRLLAFFSTRTGGEGPGLYVMRLDGGRPKRITPLMGDSIRWERLPPTQLVEKKK
jgi:TolB protein